ncbi:MAG TPA: hypothetical protein ENG32_02160, partial [bacterium]|nr:hypothetical protein [bacterium]
MLYIWVANTMRSGGISRRVTPPIETEFLEKEKPQEIEEKKENQKEQISEEKIKTFQYQRQELSFLKFISSENCLYSLDDSEVQKLKSLNINGIRICPLYSLGKDGSIKEEIPEFFFTNLIK